jgi:hypothetical protein
LVFILGIWVISSTGRKRARARITVALAFIAERMRRHGSPWPGGGKRGYMAEAAKNGNRRSLRPGDSPPRHGRDKPGHPRL